MIFDNNVPDIKISFNETEFNVRSCVLARDSTGNVLLQRKIGDDFWALPGGKVKVGECARAAAVREISEECEFLIDPDDLSVDRVIERISQVEGRSIHQIIFVFLYERTYIPLPAMGSELEFSYQEYNLDSVRPEALFFDLPTAKIFCVP